jgi:hypothetical protein
VLDPAAEPRRGSDPGAGLGVELAVPPVTVRESPAARQPDLLVFSTIQPVLFVLLFVYVFGGAIGRALPHGISYVGFLLPGIFVQSVTFGASQTAVGLKEDLQRGVVDRFRSMPMARSAVLAGHTVADLARNIAIIGLMIAVGYLVGFRFHGGAAAAIGCIAVVAAFGLALSWIFAFVALTVRGAETAQTAGFVVIFRPLVRDLRHPGVAGRGRGLDRRPAGRLHPAVRMALPTDQLSHVSVVRFDLVVMGQVTRLTVSHRGLDPGGSLLKVITPAWPVILSSLKNLVETGEPLEFQPSA